MDMFMMRMEAERERREAAAAQESVRRAERDQQRLDFERERLEDRQMQRAFMQAVLDSLKK